MDAALTPDVFSRNCLSRLTLQGVTGRWGLLTVAALAQGPHRFGELRRRVDGISERMLSQTLQSLERNGFVDREVLHAIPPHVEYRLTDLGATIAPRLLALIEVLEGSMGEVLSAQERYDSEHPDLT
ncbi:winged helix-turn-helix transcriptional regulator [Tomitella biformata]|uniref:winged helix-turn-helix transcriptional regulator n=1 Tax=Tomitella biformata TaxID=630403 RepID=UPI00046566FA|nr:helix-turn-helix domain-containing protein [Tomitella biformata]